MKEKNNDCDKCMGKDNPEKLKHFLDTVGFYVHYIVEPPHNYHTHGLPESFNHPDLQIALAVKKETAMNILGTVIDLIKEGQEIKDGMHLFNVICDYCIKAYKTTEDGRDIIRLLLPDRAGIFPDNPNCDEPFKIQMYDDKDYEVKNESV